MRSGCGTAVLLACASVVTLSGPVLAADPPFRITSSDGKSFLTIGLFAQPQLETLTTADGAATSKNLFLRRLRLILAGRATEKLSFFIDTDSPNLGKDTASGQKVAEYVFLQDVVLTYTFCDELQVDAGMLLFPLSHNTGQSAGTLLAIDYGPYSFVASDPTNSRIGRDYGIQGRGYLLAKHVEYRLGVFQGYADSRSTAPFRYAARAVWYPFEAETGFFYSGTSLGARRILAIGAGFDHQDHYDAQAVDVFVDQPLKSGDGLTLQLDYIHYNGGETFSQVPDQDTWLVEAGYYNKRTGVGPWAQLAGRRFSGGDAPSETKLLVGLAYWAMGHRFNIKAGGGQLGRDGFPTRAQFVVQGQVLLY